MATSSPVALFNTDPNLQAQAALLQQRQALAQKLMESGMTPIDTSNRTVGGVGYRISPMEGLAKMLQAYTGQKGVQDTTQQQAALAGQAYGALLNKYQPGSDPSYSDAQRQDAEGAGMDAGMGPPDPQKMAAALLGKQPAQGGQNQNNPQGIPANILARHDAGMINDKTFETLTAPYAPTDATKAATQGGFNPATANQTAFSFANTDPKVRALQQAGFTPQQIYQTIAAEQAKAGTDPKVLSMQQAGFTPEQIYKAIYGEAAKAGDIERRPDQFFSNPLTGERGIVPAIPPGSNPVGAPGPNGAIPGVTPIPGAQPVQQANAQAAATGTANGGLHQVTLPNGAVVPARGSEIPPLATQTPGGPLPPGMDADRAAIYSHEMQAAQQRLSTAKTPEEQARAQQDVAALTRETQRLGLRLGQSTADKTTQEAGAKLITELPVQLQQSKQTVTGLENAYKTIEAMGKSGPGVSKTVNALAVLNNMGVPLMQGDTNGYQTLKKFLENSASTAAASNGFTGSDARFEQFKNGQPNAETMNPDALKGAIRYVLSQHDAAISRAQFIQQAAQANPNDPNAVQKAQQQWSKTYNPRYFEAQRMAPEDQRAMVGKMSPQEAQAFLAWRKANRVQ